MRGTWRIRVFAFGVALAVGLVTLNATGVAPIPTGPMGDHQAAVPDVARTTLDYEPGRSAIYLTALVENTWAVPVTVVRVTPTGVSAAGSVEIVGSLPFNEDDPNQRKPDGTQTVVLGIQPSPGPTWDHPDPAGGVTVEPRGTAQHAGRAFLVRITPDPSGQTFVTRFDVEYALGPVHFLTTAWGPLGTTVTVCGEERPFAGGDYGICATTR